MQKTKQALLFNLNPDPKKDEVSGIGIRGYDFSRAFILGQLHTNSANVDKPLNIAFKRIIEIFEQSLNVNSLDEISKEIKQKKYNGTRVYLKNKCFPWPCDFIILSSCDIWKSEKNLKIVQKSIQHLSEFMPIPTIFDYVNNHYLAPICSYHAFSFSDLTTIPKGEIVFWLRDMNRLCKICNIRDIPYFYEQIKILHQYVYEDILIDKLSEQALKAIESYYSFNGKWKTDIQRKTDIYFKVLMILNNANEMKDAYNVDQ
jgi:hypothetical protein